MVSVALTAFITGITEPLEYAFAYVAFPIYAVHAVLTGSSLAIANLLGAKDGFAFSAGAIDYLLNFGKSADLSGGVVRGPLMIVIMGTGLRRHLLLPLQVPHRQVRLQDPWA